MNEISIIINGVRYDAVESKEPHSCAGCELNYELCLKANGLCSDNTVFKELPKKIKR